MTNMTEQTAQNTTAIVLRRALCMTPSCGRYPPRPGTRSNLWKPSVAREASRNQCRDLRRAVCGVLANRAQPP